MRRIAALLLLIVSETVSPAGSPAAPPSSAGSTDRLPWAKFEPSIAREVVHAFAAELEGKYLSPTLGKRYADALRSKLASGGYDNFPDVGYFAEAVTADLQAINGDGHLVLIAPVPPSVSKQGGQSTPVPHGIVKSGLIAPGLAYIDFADFPGDKETLTKLRRFIDSHAGIKAMIIDLRTHRGGWVLESDMFFHELFRRPTDPVATEMRKSVAQQMGSLEGPTIRKLGETADVVRFVNFVKPSPHPTLANTKVYVLLSHATRSAGEHFAFALKRTHRATLIGETTQGAGHAAVDYPLPAGFFGRVPIARAYDPATGKGWEGIGVKPDIQVPADRALAVALKLARVRKSARAALEQLRQDGAAPLN